MLPLGKHICKAGYAVPRPPDVRSNLHEGPWWDWYNGYLRSEIWAEVRRRVIKRARGDCQRCRSRVAVEVHHLSYDRVGHERWGDLQAVCKNCHDDVHRR